MATILKKPVKRVTQSTHYGRELVVTLEPFDLISLRQKGRRTQYTVPITAVYDMAAKVYARAEIKRRAEERKAKRSQK